MLRRVYGGILQRLRSIPGVKAAGTTNSLPLEPFSFAENFLVRWSAKRSRRWSYLGRGA
jgi:hypothetical protein